eukprot:EG_transcript_9716
MFSAVSLARLRMGLRQYGAKEVQRLRLRLKAPKRAYSAPAEAAQESNLLAHWHVDSGFWKGSAILAVLLGLGYLVPTDTQARGLTGVVKTFRALGVTEANIPDPALMNDYFRRQLLAFHNVMLASPSFYFLWHLVHNAGVVTSSVRSITGTVRIVPFLGVLYGGCAVLLPLGTNYLMNRGYEYKDASLKSTAAALFTGMAVLEALAELRGCGVTFAQMNAMALSCFSVALVGRLATGVLVQQQKIGTEFQNVLPASWQTSDGVQRALYKLCDTLCIDKDFFFTLVGTSVFQHLLNSITYVLLTRGHSTKLVHIGQYLTGGMNGTTASAVQQFGRTVGLRLGFCGCWNWLSAQTPPEFVAVDRAAKMLEEEKRQRKA